MADEKRTGRLSEEDGGWIQRVEKQLKNALNRTDAPILDIEWLLLRCADTHKMQGELAAASFQALRADVEQFCERFPTLAPSLRSRGR